MTYAQDDELKTKLYILCGRAAFVNRYEYWREQKTYAEYQEEHTADWRQAKYPQEYAAGFGARMGEMPDSDGKHPCWRSGWNDADTELLEQARHARCLEEGREDDFPGTRRLLFHAGRLARENGVAFDKARTEPWKEGWIAADIEIGTEPAF